MTRRQIDLAALAIVGALTVAGCSRPESTTQSAAPAAGVLAQAHPPASQSDPRFLADDLPLLPENVAMAVRPLSVVRASYEFAARHPEVMKFVPCFCGCERGGHRDNHDCFVGSRGSDDRVTAWETHAIQCEICLDVAHQALTMHNSGASVSAIRDAVEKRFAGAAGGHTPTPMPKHGGTSHN